MSININELSAEERRKLMEDLQETEKTEKQKLKEDKKAFKELSAEYVKKHIDNLVNHNALTEKLIDQLFVDYKNILDLKQAIYGERDQDSHTSTLQDGSASITIGYNVSIGFDGTESAGVEKIKNYIKSLAPDDNKGKKLEKMVNTLLKPNAKTGMLNPSKIIQLSNLRDEFNSGEFDEGLQIIFDAQQRRKNSMYVSGWNFIKTKEGKSKKLEFRFTV